jgi:hypothetical protein
MHCLPSLTLDTDVPFWVSKEVFFAFFDQRDFHFRDQAAPIAAYLADWFHTPQDGEPQFILPAVCIVGGKTQFISGRHRTAVLLPHLEELPIAFAAQPPNREAPQVIDRIPKRRLSLSERIWLPDLPVRERLP